MNSTILYLVGVLSVFVFGFGAGHHYSSVVSSKERAEEQVEQYGKSMALASSLYSAQLAVDAKDQQIKSLREKKVDKAVITYVKEIGNSKCLSSSGFVQFYNSTFEDPTATE